MKTLEHLQSDLIVEAKKGFPILLAGSIVFFIFTILSFLLPMKVVHLVWIFGLGAIFPLGLLLSKPFGVSLVTSKNPIATLGGIVAAPQAFFIPVFIMVYQHIPEYLPFTIGLLGGSHFLPYMWIYRSKAYLFVTLGVCLSSLLLGTVMVEQAFTVVPIAISLVYLIGVLLIFKELKTEKVESVFKA
ncbi:hypothetical protein JOC85_001055 [Bacillus mesophilus]|uniref:Uncharacterized protein n=1 Tax=Bacillus mesophilus TaxID=1808955 RepID=A0A6M0Q3T4_9BACI|nr:hypothetical protein [Bacillus mesophilus]MBM7660288.1 hypothetical protein [Bacillus mesophilus]NEY71001.1 hypothetical protein [Bacillus mesophilus]